MLWGSDRYTNPVQMVLESWLLSIISIVDLFVCWLISSWTFGLASKSLAGFDEHRSLEYQVQIEKVFLDRYCNFDYAMEMHSDAHMRWKSWRQYLPEFWFKLDSGGMLILDSGILLALSFSCSYNFKVWEVEPLCTCVKAETGDKALTS